MTASSVPLFMPFGETYAQRASLIHALAAAAAGRGFYRERYTADRAIAGEDLTMRRRIRKHVYSPRRQSFIDQIAIARFNAPSSRPARSEA
jgi:hypothetical protein